MKKYSLFLIIILIFTLLFQTGCSKEDQSNSPDWEQLIRTDFFSDNSAMEQAMAEVVSIKVKQDGDQLTVTVKAPDICDNLLNWMDSVSDEEFTEEAMEEEILNQLKSSEKVESTHSLTYTIEGDIADILYTSEFTDTISCGLNRFYAEVTQRILDELEAG